jgi:hypothetical protein
MESKSIEEVQDILKHHHIYVIDHSKPLPQFDENALATLGQLDKSIIMHGMVISLPNVFFFF